MIALIAAFAVSSISTLVPKETLALAVPSPRILVCTATKAFRHDAIPVAKTQLAAGASAYQLQLTFTEDSSDFTDANLAKYDAVMFVSTTGDILNDDQQKAFQRFIRSGGGFVGIHAASDTEHDWAWYKQMVGGEFKTHAPGLFDVVLKVDDRAHPSSQDLPNDWLQTDEWYRYVNPVDPNVEVLVSAGKPTPESQLPVGHPVIWKRVFEGGRMWYSALGHDAHSYSDPNFMKSVYEALIWVSQGRRPSSAISLARKSIGEDDRWTSVGDVSPTPDRIGLIPSGGGTTIWNGGKAEGHVPFVSSQQFGDSLTHVEFIIPKDGNSGVYVQGRYELQIRDSHDVSPEALQFSDCGGIYETFKDNKGVYGTKPLRQAARPAGSWQTLDILFRAPRFKNGKKVEDATFVEVRLNGVIVQSMAKVLEPTGAPWIEKEGALGPIVIQGDHGPCAFRNLWVLPKNP